MNNDSLPFSLENELLLLLLLLHMLLLLHSPNPKYHLSCTIAP